jgi:stringent starvation protein B
MKYRMPPLPRKQAVALDLLERTSVFVHLDPRRPGVIVPQGFLKQPQLVLQIGLNMAIAIPDLNVGEEGISCTLSFNKRPHFCSLPWSSIYALIGEQGGGMVWPEDVPPEVVSQQRAAAKKEAKPRKPGLRAVSGGAPSSSVGGSGSGGSGSGGSGSGGNAAVERTAVDRGAVGAAATNGGKAADRNADDVEIPSTRRSDTPRPAEVRRDARGLAPRPPRLVPVVSDPARSDTVSVSQAEAEAPGSSDAATHDEPARPPATKRSRPPYLRLVD